MVLPTNVIGKILSKIKKSLHLFPVGTNPIEGSEDADLSADKLSIIVYADFDERADITATGVPLDIPCSIYAICTSGGYEKAFESFNEALLMAAKIIKLVTESYFEIEDINGELEVVEIKSQEIPISILRKSADASVVQAAFTYNISRL